MMHNFLEARIRLILKELVSEVDSLADGQPLTDIGLDSLSAIELTLRLEEEFDILFDDFDLDLRNFYSIRSIVGLIEAKFKNC